MNFYLWKLVSLHQKDIFTFWTHNKKTWQNSQVMNDPLHCQVSQKPWEYLNMQWIEICCTFMPMFKLGFLVKRPLDDPELLMITETFIALIASLQICGFVRCLNLIATVVPLCYKPGQAPKTQEISVFVAFLTLWLRFSWRKFNKLSQTQNENLIVKFLTKLTYIFLTWFAQQNHVNCCHLNFIGWQMKLTTQWLTDQQSNFHLNKRKEKKK